MLEESTGHSSELINAAEQAMSEYFQTTIHISKVIQLSEPDRRNLILRLMINQPTTGIPGSVILKKTSIEKQIFEKGEQKTETWSDVMAKHGKIPGMIKIMNSKNYFHKDTTI